MEQKKLKNIANNIALKIKNSDLNANPFQHLVIDDFSSMRL